MTPTPGRPAAEMKPNPRLLTFCSWLAFAIPAESATATSQLATSQPTGETQYAAFMSAAAAYERAGNNAQSIDAYRQAILAAPDDGKKLAANGALVSIESEASEYWSQLSAARAYARLGENDKAIESYRAAIVAASDDMKRTNAEDELNGFSTIHSSIATSWTRWMLELVKWPLGATVALAVVLAFLALVLKVVGSIWWLAGARRLTVRSDSPEISGGYITGCVNAIHFDFEQQPALLDRVAQLSASSSAAPTPLSIGAATSLNVGQIEPIALEKGWTIVLWRFHADLFRRASSSFALEVNAMKPKDAIGLVLTLKRRKRKCGPFSEWSLAGRWYVPMACPDVSVALNDALYMAALLIATV